MPLKSFKEIRLLVSNQFVAMKADVSFISPPNMDEHWGALVALRKRRDQSSLADAGGRRGWELSQTWSQGGDIEGFGQR